ncbi:hypothetical protein FF1_005111 [Malus domestica]
MQISLFVDVYPLDLKNSLSPRVVGLSFYTNEKGLSEAFSQYGQVIEAQIVSDSLRKIERIWIRDLCFRR